MNLPHDRRARGSDLSTDGFHAIRAMIHEFCGIYFEENKRYLLESRVRQRMQATRARSHEDYLRLLQRDGPEGELSALINAVTINETYFFRHPHHLDLIVQLLIPEFLSRRKETGIPRIRIWSAACSSGDEAYSVAILIRERIQPIYPRAMIEIVATDIDTAVLQSARRASYSEYAVRNVPKDLLEKYFTLHDGKYVLDPTVRDMVRFRSLNLMDDTSMRSMTGFDIILCANVLIYFDGSARRHALDLLHRSINPGGYLFLGFSETLYGMSDQFVPVRFDRTLVYRRTEVTPDPEAHSVSSRPRHIISNQTS